MIFQHMYSLSMIEYVQLAVLMVLLVIGLLANMQAIKEQLS